MKFLVALSPILVLIEASFIPRGPQGRIVGGFEAEPHSIPHQVGMLSYMPEDTIWCGGSLVSTEWVLTAAHCVKNSRRIVVMLGLHDLNRTEATRVSIQVDTENMFVHPNWTLPIIQNDVALLRLSTPAPINDYIKTVRLPSRREVLTGETFVGKTAKVSGWGQTSNDPKSSLPQLRYIKLPVLSNEVCGTYFFGLIGSHLCIDGTGIRGTCQGDSGGPLTIVDDDGALTQIGIVSFVSPLGCEEGWPSVFSRLTIFMDWIESITGPLN